MGKRTDIRQMFTAAPLTMGGVTQFQREFTTGEGWLTLWLRFNLTLVIGTGSGALTEALVRIIENIQFFTDVDGIIFNCPGRALYKRAHILMGRAPVADAFSAASNTYRIMIPFHFQDPRMSLRPEDTILDTSRYKQVTMQVNMGGVNRLLSTVGTASVTGTLDCEVEVANGPLKPQSKPILYPYVVSKPGVNPNSQNYVDLEVGGDLGVKRLLVFTSDGSDSSVNSGDSFQGTPLSNIINLLTVEDQDGAVGALNLIDDMIQRRNVLDYQLDGGAVIAGLYVIDYAPQGSLQDAEYVGLKSKFQVRWTNDVIVASSRVHTLIDGVRALKPVG